MNTSAFEADLVRRGFSPSRADWYRVNSDGPFVGLQRVERAAPEGELRCYEKGYWGGSRLICYVSSSDEIKWADAGWMGASF